MEDELRLSGWSKARRVVVLRRRIKHDIALASKKRGKHEANGQLVLALPHDEVQHNAQVLGVHRTGDQRELRHRGHRPALPRPLRLRERL